MADSHQKAVVDMQETIMGVADKATSAMSEAIQTAVKINLEKNRSIMEVQAKASLTDGVRTPMENAVINEMDSKLDGLAQENKSKLTSTVGLTATTGDVPSKDIAQKAASGIEKEVAAGVKQNAALQQKQEQALEAEAKKDNTSSPLPTRPGTPKPGG